MSLILDALNRARQDSEQVPGLGSNHVQGSAVLADAGSTSRLQWLLVAALAAAVLVIGWLLLDRESPAPPAPSPVQPAQATSRPEPVISPAPAATAPAPAAVAELPEARPEPPRPVKQTVSAAADAGVAALYRQRQTESEPATAPQAAPGQKPVAVEPQADALEEEALDIEQLVSIAEAELADARLDDNGVPFLSTLSQQTKDAIPTLMYQRHDYSGNPAQSSVLINGKTLNAGGSVGGVKVVEILPDSVVLDFRDTRFRLRALNSWVNL